MLDETAMRRAGFGGGAPVVLADGQAWTLRKPVLDFVPADNEAGYEVRAFPGDDGTFGAAMLAWERAEGGAAMIGAELTMARTLLQANYELTTAQAATLLRFGYHDDNPEGCRIRTEVMAVALGRGNAPSDAGGG